MLPALARLAGLGGTYPLVIRDLGPCHGDRLWRPQAGALIRGRTADGDEKGAAADGGRAGFGAAMGGPTPGIFERVPPGGEGQERKVRPPAGVEWTGLLRWIRANSRGSRPRKGRGACLVLGGRESLSAGGLWVLLLACWWKCRNGRLRPPVYVSLSSAVKAGVDRRAGSYVLLFGYVP